MAANSISPMIAAVWYETLPSTPWIVLILGTLVLSFTLLVLMLSRLGEARPVMKCVVLSIWAHVLLVGVAYTTKMLPEQISAIGSPVRVRLVDDVELSTQETVKAWDHVEPEFIPEPLAEVERQEVDLETPERLRDEQSADFEEPRIDSEIESWATELPKVDDSMIDTESQPVDVVEIETMAPNSAVEPKQLPLPDMQELPRQDTTQIVETTSPPDNEPQASDIHDIAQLMEALNSFDDAEAIASHQDVNTSFPDSANSVQASPQRTKAHFVRSQSSVQELPEHFQMRHTDRLQQAIEHGGSLDTEAAVEASLAWLASVQNRDGRWDASALEAGRGIDKMKNRNLTGARADTAITGLALLAFLGTGQSHYEGPYKANIQKGLEYLLRSQSRNNGSLGGHAAPMAAMYCHGIATLALGEAYVLSKDARIRPFLQRAVNYTLAAQHPITGGWRYRPGDTGDTSQFGWQLMALTAAKAGGLEVPRSSIKGMHHWLDRVSAGDSGGLARYKPRERPSTTMTAEAVACRLFLGASRDAKPVEEAANHIARQGISSEESLNLYYCYYATIAMFQIHDHRWVAWNQQMTARLLPLQRQDGSHAGSWDPDTVWGRNGGRVYSTAIATLCLEIYYRYSLLEDERESNTTASRLPTLSR